jgi:hypothetical protein
LRSAVLSTLLAAGWGVASPAQAADGTDRFDASGQVTGIVQRQPSFAAAYTNLGGTPNSLLPGPATSWTVSATAYLAWRLGPTTAVHLVPEVISLEPLSDLKGLGASIQNAELQKTGHPTPTFYRSRLYLRHTWSLGGESEALEAGPFQMAESTTRRRFVLWAGNLSVIDVFDRNRYAGDPRQTFLNMAFLTHAAFDFAADARGYTWGLAGEWYHDAWTLRFGRFVVPEFPNQLSLDPRIMRYQGDQVELERRHEITGEPGAVRLLAYRNRAEMARFDDALAQWRADPSRNPTTCPGFSYGSPNASAPDLCWARRPNTKSGVGLALEQRVGDLGVFARAMWADGRTEVYSFTSSARSASVGGIVDGTRWGRTGDAIGLAFATSAISTDHAEYLANGGVDGFIGDGALRRGPERVYELFYRWRAAERLWFSVDAQRIDNPAYNRDRGPVSVYGLRAHLEF